MRQVFVETNWIVDWAAPAHHRNPAAVDLLERANRDELRLHLPAICITEARPPINERFQASDAETIRKVLRWTKSNRPDLAPDVMASYRIADAVEASIKNDLRALTPRLESLLHQPGLEVFPLDDDMLCRAVDLTAMDLQLKPFDQAILAAVLVRAERLAVAGATDLAFCNLDRDLQPWDRKWNPKEPLDSLYRARGLNVYRDFEMASPARAGR